MNGGSGDSEPRLAASSRSVVWLTTPGGMPSTLAIHALAGDGCGPPVRAGHGWGLRSRTRRHRLLLRVVDQLLALI